MLGGLARDRAVHRNLERAARLGADIAYARCDITDRADVGRLLAEVGPVTGVVHNAGLDVPARLAGKNWATVREVVRVKVVGLLNLIDALGAGTPPRMFCSVGSLTGRWGGMIGQLDYGAANEALSRLGLWAQRAPTGPAITTVAWPTWDRLGMVSNFEATLRYMSVMDVADGVARWRADLLAADSGEVTFIGDVGSFLVPGMLRGYPADSDLPGIDRLRTAGHYLGEPEQFRPGSRIASRVLLDPDALSMTAECTVRGRPAAPASLLLEHLIAAPDWIAPDGAVLDHLQDVVVDLGAAVAGTPRSWRKTADGRPSDDRWQAEIVIAADGVVAARATAVYRPATGRHPATPIPADASVGACPPPADRRDARAGGELDWSGHGLDLAAWCRHPDGAWHAVVAADRPADLFCSAGGGPVARLGFTAIENLVRASYLAGPPVTALPITALPDAVLPDAVLPGAAGPAADPPGGPVLRIGRLMLPAGPADGDPDAGGPAAGQAIRRPGPGGDSWTVLDPLGTPRLLATGVSVTVHPASTRIRSTLENA